MSKHVLYSRPPLRDWHLWAEVKRSVTPLRPQPAEDFSNQPLPIPVPRPPPAFRKGASWTGSAMPAYQPPVSLRRRNEPGQVIEPNMKRRLTRGQIDIDATIDLHGMRQAEAHAALLRFLPARAARGDRTLLVITGKGLQKIDDLQIFDRGVLRSMLPIWLAEPALAPLVAGFDVAAQGHGGAGAYYVRLRRAR